MLLEHDGNSVIQWPRRGSVVPWAKLVRSMGIQVEPRHRGFSQLPDGEKVQWNFLIQSGCLAASVEGSSISHFISATNVHILSNRHQECTAGLPWTKLGYSVGTGDLRVQWLWCHQMSCLMLTFEGGLSAPEWTSYFLFHSPHSAKLFQLSSWFQFKISCHFFIPRNTGRAYFKWDPARQQAGVCVFVLVVFLLTILLPLSSMWLMVVSLLVSLQLFMGKKKKRG
jgi:hypothetical protein